MKKTSSTAIVVILSIVAVVVITVSLLNLRAPAPISATPTTATATVILTATISQTPDPCAPENIKATITEFDKLSREFSDTFVLAKIRRLTSFHRSSLKCRKLAATLRILLSQPVYLP